jgi:hypothetical protein
MIRFQVQKTTQPDSTSLFEFCHSEETDNNTEDQLITK